MSRMPLWPNGRGSGKAWQPIEWLPNQRWQFGSTPARSTSQSRFRAGAPGLNDCSRALLRHEAGDAEVEFHGRLEADADREQVQVGFRPAVDLLLRRQSRTAQQVD